MSKNDQIILRIDLTKEGKGFHIIRKFPLATGEGEGYSIEGYPGRPENYSQPPTYYFPYLTPGEVEEEFQKQGKTFITASTP